MEPLKFSILFTLAHSIAYTLAGALALQFSKDIYESKARLCTFLRDMSDEKESRHVQRWFLPVQIPRAVLMSIVLYPVLGSILAMNPAVQFLFFASLMFVFTHLAAASPFLDNIEGLVYFRESYLNLRSFWKFQGEMLLYSLLFALLAVFGMSLWF